MLFDASTFNDRAKRDILPQGSYRLMIEECVKKPTKDGSGAYLAFTFVVLDGEHAGRKLWHNFNLWNKSAQAVEIAQGEIKELCAAVGMLAPKTEQEFEGKTLVGAVKVAKRKDTGDAENRVSGYTADGGPGVALPSAPRATAPNAPKWSTARPAA
jgi:hypothetical protein